MTTAARESEARQADAAFQVALAQIGAGTIEDALAVWRGLDPTDIAATTGAWLTRAINLILGRRRMSRDLAMAYYRLARALRTGKTIADPFHPEPDYVTLGDLRREFRDLVQEIDTVHTPVPAEPLSEEPAPNEDLIQLDSPDTTEDDAPDREDDIDRILIEEIEALRNEELRLEQAAEEAARADLAELGPVLLQARLDDLDPEGTLADAEARVQEEAQAAGARVAATSERIVLNGGRGSTWAYADRDARVIAWARVSMSGDPCSFCAMLISRGMTYKSKQTARFDANGDLYHNNCHCTAVPIFSVAQYETDPAMDQNRILEKLWEKEIKDNWSGKDARNAWRRLIDGGRRNGDAHWIVNPTNSPYAVQPATPAAAA